MKESLTTFVLLPVSLQDQFHTSSSCYANIYYLRSSILSILFLISEILENNERGCRPDLWSFLQEIKLSTYLPMRSRRLDKLLQSIERLIDINKEKEKNCRTTEKG